MDTLLNVQEAADLLGVHIDTIKRWAASGRVPAYKAGRHWRFRRSELLEALRHTPAESKGA